MTADDLYKLHRSVQDSRERLSVVAAALLEEAGMASLGEALDQLEDVEGALFEAYCDAVRKECA